MTARASSAGGTARVVVPAFRSEATIRRTVAAILQSQTDFDFSVVVVDDGGNKDLRGLLFDFPVEILATGGTGSAAAARNAGARDFDGRILIFVDADVIVEPNCLARLTAPLFSNRAEASVGNYSTAVGSLEFATRYKLLYTAAICSRRRGYLRNQFWTAIGAVDALAFRNAGAFNTCFKGANGEDAELGARLTASGYRIIAVPDALGLHCHTFCLRAVLHNDWAKGVGAVTHYKKNGGALSDNRHATMRDSVAVLLAVLLAGLPLVLPFLTFPLPIKGLVATVFAALYLATRAELLLVFAQQSFWFLVRACALMCLLDVVRFGCLAYGFWIWHFRELRLRSIPRTGALAEEAEEALNRGGDT